MGLFLVLFWCAAVARAVLRYNSRFAGSNSRLGANKFPFSRQRELAGKGLIYLAVFGADTALFRHNRENSRFHGKNREFRPPAKRALAQPAPPIPKARSGNLREEPDRTCPSAFLPAKPGGSTSAATAATAFTTRR